ncbi:hypothetical protein ACROYT_G002793 [Oculina patagonica]
MDQLRDHVTCKPKQRGTERLEFAGTQNMGRIFLDHPGGTTLYSCANCDTALTNRSELTSMRFNGATGRAFLFKKVVNLTFSEVQDRVMLTGRHMVRDVFCKNCDTKLGWMYEYATEESQQYKEGQVILERALVTESEGIEEIVFSEKLDAVSSALVTVTGWRQWIMEGRSDLYPQSVST